MAAPRWQAIRDLGLAVRWTTLAEGLRASQWRSRPVVTVGDIGAWADACVEARPEQPEDVYVLLGIAPGTGNDGDAVDSIARELDRLSAGEQADRRAELAKWRLVEVAALVDAASAWPTADDDSAPACELWSHCRELWESWVHLVDRPAFFYRPDGRECSCYYGRDLAEVLADYRGWIAGERDRLAALDAAADAR